MSHYPMQDASCGATGSGDQCPDAALIFADSQGLNLDNNPDYIASFDLDLLASQLWPDSGAAPHSGPLGSTFLFPREEVHLSLGSVNPNDVFKAQQTLPSTNTEQCVGFKSYGESSSVQSESFQYDSLTCSFQDYNFQNEPFNYAHATAPVEYQDQPTHIPNPDVTFYGEEAGVPSASPGNVSSRKRKSYRHRHERQFLESEVARKERSRILNNEASVLYRNKMRGRYEEARVELEELEKKNQQLSERFRLLKEFCSLYRNRLEALNVPVTNTS